MALVYAELSHSRIQQPSDHERAIKYFEDSMDAWRKFSAHNDLKATQEREMHESAQAMASIKNE
jgi:hypothetical protein